MKEKKVERVGFEPFSLDGCHQIELLIVDRKSNPRKLAEVGGSTPTQSIFYYDRITALSRACF
jgi:hypothetical protein